MAENSPERKNAANQNENDNDSERRIMGKKKRSDAEKKEFFFCLADGVFFCFRFILCTVEPRHSLAYTRAWKGEGEVDDDDEDDERR